MEADFENEIKLEFLTECEELLADAENAFLRLEHERDNDDLINEIFRLAHNLKGSSRAVGFEQMADLTHAAETFVLKIKDKEIQINDNVVSALLNFKDLISEMCEVLKGDLSATFDIEAAKASFSSDYSSQDFEPEPASASEPIPDVESTVPIVEEEETPPSADAFDAPDVQVAAAPEPAKTEAPKPAVEPAASQAAALSEPPEEVAQPPKAEVPKPEVQKAEAPSAPPAAKAELPKEEETIRVSLSRIDDLNNMIGELVILQTILTQRGDQHIKDSLSQKSIAQMGKIFKEAQELSLSLRMLPLRPTFQKMSRIVRDAAKSLDKNANLVLEGEYTEVDKTILQKITDPLVHIIRNAIDHGLETKAERAETDKPQFGTIKLSARHEGNNLVLEVIDDGRGINPAKLREKATEKGILKPNDKISDQDAINLIFHPGFSTASVVSDISGRGVGMDVVRTNIEKLGGNVLVQSVLGVGSTFRITLPLTLAIIDGLIVACGNDYYVVPLSQVFELTNLVKEKVEDFTQTATLFKLRDEVIPVFNLENKLSGKPSRIDLNDEKPSVVLVIRGLGDAFGVAVSDIVAQQQIVIKKLGHDINSQQGIMGSAIMGDGKPIVIVDLFEAFRDELRHRSRNRN